MPTASVQDLRLLLRKKFPQAHAARFDEPSLEENRLQFSDPATFPAGSISEIIPSGPEPVLGLLLAEILGTPETPGDIPDLVLIDGDSFDPCSFPPHACSRVLWVRCWNAATLMKAADLLIRDGNIPFVLLDGCHFPEREMRALPASNWWRLKQMAERNGCRVLVLSPFPLVPCATLRLSLSSGLTLADFDRPREELIHEIHIHPQRGRRAN